MADPFRALAFYRVPVAKMIHHVSLSELPADLQVPEELTERFWYDTERRQLCFEGFMSKCSYDKLGKLSRDEKYQRALEELFRICVPDEIDRSPRKRVGVLVAVAGLAALCGLAVWLVVIR